MKIVILDDWEDTVSQFVKLEELRELSDVVIYQDQPSAEVLKARLKDADVVIPIRERTKFTKEIVDSMEKIQLIAQTGTGIAHIDMAEINRRKIPVSRTPGGATAAVTELTMGFMLALARDLLNLSGKIKKGEWPLAIGSNLSNKTLGIIGLGEIGSSVAKAAAAFGMKVIAWGPTLTKERADQQGAAFVSFDDLLQQSHFITVHVRLTPETKHLLQRQHFERMREDAFFINTSRAEIVDEDALIWALRNNRIRGAGLDVFTSEPLPPNHPFTTMDHVILAPHIGWKTDNTLEYFLNASIDNIKSYFSRISR